MLRSMTGYGRGEASAGDVTVLVELRSVNNRFRDLQLRCPREYLALEPRINNMLKDPFARGRIDAFVRRSHSRGPSVRITPDLQLARRFVDAAMEVARAVDAKGGVPLEVILAQPGVMNLVEDEVDVMSEWTVVETALDAAIADLLSMREVEGEALKVDLGEHLGALRTCVAEVAAASVGINERLRQRVETRVRRLLGDRVDLARVAQEAAILADKADVNEEVTRLQSHCDQFADALASEGPIGRRLDFLLQEMHREVNTIGSKAAEHPVSHRVVEMKSVLERMREQSANVE